MMVNARTRRVGDGRAITLFHVVVVNDVEVPEAMGAENTS